MKRISAVFIVLVLRLFAESPEEKITPARPQHAGYEFYVVASPLASSGKASDIQRVVVAIKPPAKAVSRREAYVEMRRENTFVYSGLLGACRPEDLPIALRHKVPRDAILFTFNIGSDAISESWFSYQLPRSKEGFDPTNCVIRLSDFLQAPNQPSEPTSGLTPGRGSP
jgi:hypothetical protein